LLRDCSCPNDATAQRSDNRPALWHYAIDCRPASPLMVNPMPELGGDRLCSGSKPPIAKLETGNKSSFDHSGNGEQKWAAPGPGARSAALFSIERHCCPNARTIVSARGNTLLLKSVLSLRQKCAAGSWGRSGRSRTRSGDGEGWGRDREREFLSCQRAETIAGAAGGSPSRTQVFGSDCD
jgi:hypothetical protein